MTPSMGPFLPARCVRYSQVAFVPLWQPGDGTCKVVGTIVSKKVVLRSVVPDGVAISVS